MPRKNTDKDGDESIDQAIKDQSNISTTVPDSYLTIEEVAEKTWEVTLNEGAANIVIDLLTSADPGPAKTPEIRVYTEQPQHDLDINLVREVISYENEINPKTLAPIANWKPQVDNATATIQIPHDIDWLPLIDVEFPEDKSATVTRVTVYDFDTTTEDGDLSYTVGDAVFSKTVNTAVKE